MKEIQKYEGIQKITIVPYERKAQYYETDQMGVIHHSNYIRWMEEARMDLLGQLGFSYQEMENMEIISPVISVSCDYQSMVHFNDTVVIDAHIASFDGIRMQLEYRITDKDNGELRALGKSSHCFLNRSGQPISLKRIYPEISTRFFEMVDDE